MARFVAEVVRSVAQINRVDLHLRRLAIELGDPARRIEILQATKPDYVGARERARRKGQLEECCRGHLVLYDVRRFHF